MGNRYSPCLNREVILAFASVLPALLPGCYAGAAAVALGIISASSGGGGGKANLPPQTTLLGQPVRVDGERVLVRYLLLDDDGGPLDVSVDWGPADGPGPFHPATESREEIEYPRGTKTSWKSQGKTGLLTEPGRPRETVFIWDARSDLRQVQGLRVAPVRLRITSREVEKGLESQPPAQSEPVQAGNELPQMLELRGPGSGAGLIGLVVRIADSTRDPVRLKGSFRIGRSGADREMALIGGPLFPSEPAGSGGQEHSIVWDSQGDFHGSVSDDIYVRIAASDEFDRDVWSPPSEFGPIHVDDNGDPSVLLDEVSFPPDGSFGAPLRIRFAVRDDERHPVGVILQWAARSDLGFPPLTDLSLTAVPETLGEADREYLRDLLTSPDDLYAKKRRDLHILTEAPPVVGGALDGASGLPLDQIRATDFVRRGLVHQLSGGDAGEAPEVFLIGKTIRFLDEGGKPVVLRKIEAFDPRTSIATLDRGLAEHPPAGARYELGTGMDSLPSSKVGLLHPFLWNCLQDMKDASGADLNSEVRLQARGFDAQIGPPSVFDPHRGLVNQLIIEDPSEKTPAGKLDDELSSAAIGDINTDGRNDLVVAVRKTNSVLLYLQSAAGKLELQTGPPGALPNSQEKGPYQVAAGDIDGDGWMDVLALNRDSRSVTVFLHGPSGELRPPQAVKLDDLLVDQVFNSFSSGEVGSIALGDVDSDGRLDLVVGVEGPTVNIIPVLIQDSQGAFVPDPDHSLGTVTGATSVAIGDVDRSGLNGVVSAESSPGIEAVHVYLQIRGEGLSPVESMGLTVRETPVSVALGDLDGDGGNDIVVASQNTSSLGVYFQRGTPEIPFLLDPQLTLATAPGLRPASVALGDLDGDGRLDIAAVNEFSDNVALFLHDASGEIIEHACLVFRTSKSDRPPPGPRALVVGDMNGDRLDDVVAVNSGNGKVSVNLQNPFGSLRPRDGFAFPAVLSPGALSVGDVNGDGASDVVVAARNSSSLAVHLGAVGGESPSTPDLLLAAGDQISSLALGDLDGDGMNDIAVSSAFSPKLTLFCPGGSGAASGTPSWTDDPDGAPSSLAIADLDGDGRNDLVVTNGSVGTMAVYRQAGEGGLPDHPIASLPAGSFPVEVAVGDLNGDGRKDVAVANQVSATIGLFLQDPAGDLVAAAKPIVLLPGAFPGALQIGDLDADDRDDLMVADMRLDLLHVYLQTPGGGLPSTPSRTLSTGRRLALVALGDLSGDGRNDVAVVTVADETTSLLSVYVQYGSGSFLPFPAPVQRLVLPFPAGSLALGDLDGDGRNEVAVSSLKDRQVRVYGTTR